MRYIERTPEYLAAKKQKDCETRQRWLKKNADRHRDQSLKGYYAKWEENKEKARIRAARKRGEHPEADTKEMKAERMREWRQKTRLQVLALYGTRCACCGIENPHLLTLDHVNDDGALDRGPRYDENGKRIGKDQIFLYRTLLTVPEARPRFQLLCFNCNCGKGKCRPHRPPPLSQHWYFQQLAA